MINKQDIQKLENYFKDKSTPEEERYILKLISDNEEDLLFKEWMREKFDSYFHSSETVNYNLTPVLHKIHTIIQEAENTQKGNKLQQIYRWYAKVAAILFIPILLTVGFSLFNNGFFSTVSTEESVQAKLVAPLGSRINFTFPDGTSGWLNSGSEIDYELPFNNNRNIHLTGEAWFDVAHDEANPFKINTGQSSVTVHGTKFNVNAYPNDEYIEVSLEEGKVSFLTQKLTSEIVMKPNERLVLSGNKINIYQEDVQKYGEWRKGKLIFRGDSMIEVARRIERWYNVEVQFDNNLLEDYTFTGTFQDDSIEEVMKYLSMTSPIKYKIIERSKSANSSSNKKKIIIYPNP